MTSARAQLMALESHFRMSLPSMCLYCNGGWVAFDSEGGASVVCAHTSRLPADYEHGTQRGYDKGCRCDRCREASRASSRKRLDELMAEMREMGVNPWLR